MTIKRDITVIEAAVTAGPIREEMLQILREALADGAARSLPTSPREPRAREVLQEGAS